MDPQPHIRFGVNQRRAALTIGWLHMIVTMTSIFLVMGVIAAGYKYSSSPGCISVFEELPRELGKPGDICRNILARGEAMMLGATIVFLIGVLALLPPLSLIYGTYKESEQFLLPFLTFQVLGHFTAIVAIVMLASMSDAACALLGMFFGLQLYETLLIFLYYQHLRNKRAAAVRGVELVVAPTEASNA